MNLIGKLSCATGYLLLGLISLAPAFAASITGSFTSDDQMLQQPWTLSGPANVTAFTNSYSAGGFVPVLSLFNSTTGALIAVDGGDASCTNGRMKDSTTGLCNDAYLSASVAAGKYVVVLTEFDNYPVNGNLSGGFSQAGKGNFTSASCGTSGPFWETDLAPCVQRTGNYSLNLSNTPTPEPATGWLALPVIALAVYRSKKGRSKQIVTKTSE